MAVWANDREGVESRYQNTPPQSKNWTRALTAGLCAAAILIATATEADARRRGKNVYSPPYAAVVLDANSGRILHATNANAHRYPASITKVMTLYMLFEQLEKKALSLNSRIVFSRNASRQPPSKLGLKPGQSISVEQAILALVTKSANDVAVAVAETIGGTEPAFAQLMTSKARALGMHRTRFANASGLPNKSQVTTARDLARLGRAIRSHFPRYYGYFSTRNFRFGRRNLRNHNKLLGRVRGVDGIKTGYTRASGFNLLTSARYGNRHIIAVVLGGKSGRWRDAVMSRLVAGNIRRGATRRTIAAIPKPSATRRYAAVRNEPTEREPVKLAAVPKPPVRPSAPAPAARPKQQPEAAGTPLRLSAYSRVQTRQAPGRPAVVSGTVKSSDLIPVASIPGVPPRRPVIIDGSTSNRAILADAGTSHARRDRTATPSDLRWVRGPAPGRRAISVPVPPKRIAAPARLERQQPASAAPKAAAPRVEKNDPATSVRRPKAANKGLMIQVGATDDIAKAKKLLTRAKARSQGALADAKPFTEPVRVRGTTLYRARFAGLSEHNAQRICRTLKRSGLRCFTTKH